LHNSFKKYGWEHHKFEIIEICCISSLSSKEKYWISHYDSINEGLNIRDGGPTVGFRGGDIRKKMSDTWRSKNEEELSIINEKRRIGNLGKSKPGAGCRFFTEEHRKNLSKSSKGKPKPQNNKPVLMLNKITGDVVRKFKSITEASKFIGVKPSTLSGCLLGKSKTSGGYKWEYKKSLII